MANMTPIPSGTDPAQVTAMINNNFRSLNNEQVTKLYNDATGTPSILIGVDNTGKSVIKVAKAGKDVTTAIDADLAFNSSQNTLKVVATGTTTIVKAASTTYAESFFTHGLGFAPVVIASGSYNGGVIKSTLPMINTENNGAVGLLIKLSAIDSSDVVFSVTTPSTGSFYLGSYTITIKYYFLQETID
jgi:hypothetical protein